MLHRPTQGTSILNGKMDQLTTMPRNVKNHPYSLEYPWSRGWIGQDTVWTTKVCPQKISLGFSAWPICNIIMFFENKCFQEKNKEIQTHSGVVVRKMWSSGDLLVFGQKAVTNTDEKAKMHLTLKIDTSLVYFVKSNWCTSKQTSCPKTYKVLSKEKQKTISIPI